IESIAVLPQVIIKLNKLGYFHEGNLGVENREAFARRDEKVPYAGKYKNNRSKYTEGKTEFVQSVMEKYKKTL
ncbi:hypothetical protein, partial [Mycobacterium tuberculosis]|uniref:hypothetical protein n=1 Tax=Mycobacterium tuberculosis TaxID=1773 RepID=UPI001BE04A39